MRRVFLFDFLVSRVHRVCRGNVEGFQQVSLRTIVTVGLSTLRHVEFVGRMLGKVDSGAFFHIQKTELPCHPNTCLSPNVVQVVKVIWLIDQLFSTGLLCRCRSPARRVSGSRVYLLVLESLAATS
jgi:hypothetical protein